MLDKAIAIASKAFEGKFDKGGSPYILHCLHVMYGVEAKGEATMAAAVMHDLIEDTDWTLDDLRNAGFSEEIVEIVNKVTHKASDTYKQYLDRIAPCPQARAIKLADLEHNSDINRLKGLRDKDFDRMKKYQRAHVFLRSFK